MDNKVLFKLIKKDLAELQTLLEAMEEENIPNQLLIDITIGRTKTLLQELTLLQGTSSMVKSEKTETIVAEPIVVSEPQPTEEVDTHDLENFVNDETSDQSNTAVDEVLNEMIMNEPDDEPIQNVADEEQDEISGITKEEESIVETPKEETTVESITEDTNTEAQEVLEVKNETAIEVQAEVKIEVVQETIVDEPVMDSLEEKKVLGEKFVKEPTLNERLAATKNQESKIKAKPITNLKAAIGLNDKFMFVRELFNNNSSQFDQCIADLDNCKTLLEGIEYLEKNFKWTKTEASLKFISLVKQRFSI